MNHLRLARARIARVIALLACTSAGPAARAASVTASVSASNVKPLIITKLTDLDLGSVTLGPGAWTNAIISISQAGALGCASTNLTCTGATSAASYNVQGSNQQVVNISAPNVTLVNQNDPTKTLTLTTDAPSSLTLANSGFPGTNFSIGGSVTVDSTTAAGTYVGTFNVTVDY
jgi:hypothetical protein